MDRRRIGVRAIIFKDGKILANKFHTEDGESVHWATTSHGASELTRMEFIDPTEYLLPKFLQTIDIDSYITAKKQVFLFSELS